MALRVRSLTRNTPGIVRRYFLRVGFLAGGLHWLGWLRNRIGAVGPAMSCFLCTSIEVDLDGDLTRPMDYIP